MKSTPSRLMIVLMMMFFSFGIYALEEKTSEKPDFNSMIEDNARTTENLNHSLQRVYTGESTQDKKTPTPASDIHVEKDRARQQTTLSSET